MNVNRATRVRAAGMLVDESERLLLALEMITPSGTEIWVPPGGGLEPNDQSVIACLQREYREETGLAVRVGDLVYVREFREADTHHVELFFTVHDPGGDLAHTDRATAPLGQTTVRCARWFTQEELQAACVRPEELQSRFWEGRAAAHPPVYLGVAEPVR